VGGHLIRLVTAVCAPELPIQSCQLLPVESLP
jgi:hypothetical protein